MSPNVRTIGFWAATALFCLAMVAGGVANLVSAQPQAEAMASLGYPLYLMPFLGVAKLLGVVALLIPGQKLLKEWAYAGFTFDLLGAAYSHAQSGDGLPGMAPALAVLLLGAASYIWRPATRRL